MASGLETPRMDVVLSDTMDLVLFLSLFICSLGRLSHCDALSLLDKTTTARFSSSIRQCHVHRNKISQSGWLGHQKPSPFMVVALASGLHVREHGEGGEALARFLGPRGPLRVPSFARPFARAKNLNHR